MNTKSPFPTELAVSLAKASDVHELFEGPHGYTAPLAAFQRLCLVTDYETAFKALNPYLITKPNEQQIIALQLIGNLVKEDCLSLAMEELVRIINNGRSEKDKLAAAAIMNELYGDKNIVEDAKLTDKLTINLVNE